MQKAAAIATFIQRQLQLDSALKEAIRSWQISAVGERSGE